MVINVWKIGSLFIVDSLPIPKFVASIHPQISNQKLKKKISKNTTESAVYKDIFVCYLTWKFRVVILVESATIEVKIEPTNSGFFCLLKILVVHFFYIGWFLVISG